MLYLVGLIVLISVYTFIGRKFRNPYTCIGLFGLPGCGKTTLSTKLAYEHLNNGWIVYSDIRIPGTYYFDIEEWDGTFTPPPDTVLILDEIGIYFSNRDFAKFKKTLLYWFKMHRHYKVKIIYNSQSYNDMDKKIRDLTDELMIIRRFAHLWTIARYIGKKMDISNDTTNENNVGGKIIEKYFYRIQLPKFCYIPHWGMFFDSFDKKELQHIEGTFIEMDDTQRQIIKLSKYLKYKLYRFFKSSFRAVKSKVSHLTHRE